MLRRVLPLFLIAIVATGCSSASEQDATRDEATGEIAENEDIGVFRLQVGDCLILPSGGFEGDVVETLEAIPCTDLHDGEVMALVTVPGGDDAPYPGEAAISEQALADCVSEFEVITGNDFMTDPDWDITYLSPSADSWDLADDREIVCIVAPLDGSQTTDRITG